MGWRNVALVLSILLTVASLALTAYRGLNLGIDFVGGQVVRATFAQPVDIEDLRGKVSALNVGDKAPDFELESSKGGKLKLSDLKGKNVLINFYVLDFSPT